jgi:hypothetical protein
VDATNTPATAVVASVKTNLKLGVSPKIDINFLGTELYIAYLDDNNLRAIASFDYATATFLHKIEMQGEYSNFRIKIMYSLLAGYHYYAVSL